MTKTALGFQLLVLSFLFSSFCYAQAISSTELINKAKEFDGKTVVYQGEVIGDVMKRGDFAWINVNDGQNAIGIWVDNALTKDITYTGRYKFLGDAVEVAGKFNRACPEHGGDLDIHAASLVKIKTGKPQAERVSRNKKNVTILSIGVLGIVWILHLLKRR